jgi:hypothetical protein
VDFWFLVVYFHGILFDTIYLSRFHKAVRQHLHLYLPITLHSDYLMVLLLSIFWVMWFWLHPFNKKSKVAFHLSEGTFDYTPPIIAVGLCILYSCVA